MPNLTASEAKHAKKLSTKANSLGLDPAMFVKTPSTIWHGAIGLPVITAGLRGWVTAALSAASRKRTNAKRKLSTNSDGKRAKTLASRREFESWWLRDGNHRIRIYSSSYQGSIQVAIANVILFLGNGAKHRHMTSDDWEIMSKFGCRIHCMNRC